MAVVNNLKQFLLEYYRHRHFDLMPADVYARYQDFKDKQDFNGNMKWWTTELDGEPLPTLDPSKEKELFTLIQNALQGMDANKKKYVHNKPIKDFINDFFGKYRTFKPAQPTTGVTDAFAEILHLLENTATRNAFERILKNQGLITDDISYQDLIDGIRDGKYNTDVKFRNQALQVADYIINSSQYYGVEHPDTATTGLTAPEIDADRWPIGLRLSADDAFTRLYLPSDTNDWFEAAYDPDEFRAEYPKILDKLLTSETVRKEFANYETSGKIVGQLDAAIKDTDYSNPESKDFIPPKTNDSKNVIQTIKSWKEKTFENYLRKFTEPGRGTRLYFSPWSQEIMKAIDKEKIKPTDGIDGILKKKDAILRRLTSASPTGKKHFEWFVKTMDVISKQDPDAFADALKGGVQLRTVVGRLIIAAAAQGKTAEAKTALEMLAVSKYGLTTSKTMDALAKEDFTILSDPKLSFNKNGMETVTKVADKMLKLGVMTAGRTFAAIRNGVRRKRSKFNNDIRKDKDLKAAYEKWQTEDTTKRTIEENINIAHNVDGRLTELATGHGRSGLAIDATNIATARATLATMTTATAGYAELKEDIEEYDDLTDRKDLVDNWRDRNKDPFHDLTAYWDLMMSAMKTHSFSLGTLKARAEFLKVESGHSLAKQTADAFIANYGALQYS